MAYELSTTRRVLRDFGSRLPVSGVKTNHVEWVETMRVMYRDSIFILVTEDPFGGMEVNITILV